MTTTVTSRHFKAHQSLVDYAEQTAESLSKYYDGILKCEVILSFEKKRRGAKTAELILSVYRHRITAEETADDFFKSIDKAFHKVRIQLKKYKDRLHNVDRKTVRRVREKVS